MTTFSSSTDEKLLKLKAALDDSQHVHVNGKKYTEIANYDAEDLVRIGYILVSSNNGVTFAMLSGKGEERLAELAELVEEDNEQNEQDEQDFAFEGSSLFGDGFLEAETIEADPTPAEADSSKEAAAMQIIREKGGATANAVAKQLGLDADYIKSLLNQLVDKGALDKTAKTYKLAEAANTKSEQANQANQANQVNQGEQVVAHKDKGHKKIRDKELIVGDFLKSLEALLNALID